MSRGPGARVDDDGDDDDREYRVRGGNGGRCSARREEG